MNRSQLNSTIWRYAHLTLKLDDEAYRNVIREVTTDKEKVSLCTSKEANLVFAALRRFRNGQLGGRQRGTGTAGINEPQHKFIARLMEYLGWGWATTAKFCKKITGLDNTRKCSSAELRKVCRGMIAIIDQNIESGRLKLSPDELVKYRLHTQPHRHKQTPHFPPLGGGTEGGVAQTQEVPCSQSQ